MFSSCYGSVCELKDEKCQNQNKIKKVFKIESYSLSVNLSLQDFLSLRYIQRYEYVFILF